MLDTTIKNKFLSILDTKQYTENLDNFNFSNQLLTDMKISVSDKENSDFAIIVGNKALWSFISDITWTETGANISDKKYFVETGIFAVLPDTVLIKFVVEQLSENYIAVMNLNTNKTHITYLYVKEY